MRFPVAALAILSLLFLSAHGCSDPTTNGTLSGTVELQGTMTDATGASLGPLVEDAADGVPVTLLQGEVAFASTTTKAGAFEFAGLEEGHYRVRAGRSPIMATSAHVPVSDSSPGNVGKVVVAESASVLFTAFPNPHSGSVSLAYSLQRDGDVLLRILDAGMNVTRTIVDATQPRGFHTVLWDGKDDLGTDVPPGTYWAVLEPDSAATEYLLLKRNP